MWRRIGRNSLIFGGGAILMAILQAVYRLIAIDQLSVSHYGQVALIISIFNGIALAGMAGVPVALARLGAHALVRSVGQQTPRLNVVGQDHLEDVAHDVLAHPDVLENRMHTRWLEEVFLPTWTPTEVAA